MNIWLHHCSIKNLILVSVWPIHPGICKHPYITHRLHPSLLLCLFSLERVRNDIKRRQLLTAAGLIKTVVNRVSDDIKHGDASSNSANILTTIMSVFMVVGLEENEKTGKAEGSSRAPPRWPASLLLIIFNYISALT